MGGYSQTGLTRTFDVMSRFVGKSLPTYLRVLNSTTVQAEEFVQFGFQVSASGQAVQTDVLIDPPAVVTDISLRDIGLNAAQIPFGSKRFMISQSWVSARQQSMGYLEPGTNLPDWYRVFRDPSVVGLWYNSRLFKIISIVPEATGRAPLWWTLIGAFQEQPVVP